MKWSDQIRVHDSTLYRSCVLASGHVMVRMTMASRIASTRVASIRDPQYGAARAARTSPKARGRDPQAIETFIGYTKFN